MIRPEEITDQVREDAATICASAASTPGAWYSEIENLLELDFESNGLDSPGYKAHELAVQAYKASQFRGKRLLRVGDPLIDAEAEAKIRSGWAPTYERRFPSPTRSTP